MFPSPDSPTVISAPVISADALHEMLLQSHVIGNQARRKFLEGLLAMQRSRLYLMLGFPSVVAYSEKSFGLPRSQSYEFLRVAEALESLPRLDEAFRKGELSWSALREISRVATAETEAEWLAFKEKHTFQELRAEVQDAIEKNRSRPRGDRYGLPNITVDLRFKLQKEEHVLVEAAFGKLAEELGGSLGDEKVDSKAVLLFLAERVLETDRPADLGGRIEREDSPYTVLYHVCPDCRSSRIATGEGLVEVAAEVVERVEGEAERVEIDPEEEDRAVPGEDRDRPNPPQLVKKVRLRDGRVCSNPFCRRRTGLHAHHIEFRAHGGRTALSNEKLVCSVCHSLLHQGLLEIEGDPLRGVQFKPVFRRGARTSLRDLTEEFRSLSSSPRIVIAEVPESGQHEKSRMRDSHSVEDPIAEGLIAAVRGLGYSAKQARCRVDRATTKLTRGVAEVAEEEILAEALRC